MSKYVKIYETNNLTANERDFLKANDAIFAEQKNVWVIEKTNEKGIKNIKDLFSVSKEIWQQEFEKSEDNLYYLMKLKQRGMPINSEQRINLFNILNQKKEGNYPIDLGGIFVYYPEIKEIYDFDSLYEKLPDVLNNAGNFKKNIKKTELLTDEEKALALLMFPLKDDILKEMEKAEESEQVL